METLEKVNTPTVTIDLVKVSTSPFAGELSQAVNIVINESENLVRNYVIYSVNEKIMVASRITSKETSVQDTQVFDTAESLLSSRYLNEVPKFDKDLITKLFDNTIQVQDNTVSMSQPIMAWITDKIGDCDESSISYIYKLAVLDFINTIIASKQYDYMVSLGYARSTESSANPHLPQRRSIIVKIKDAYTTKRADLEKQYSAFNSNEVFAEYSIYKTDLNAENEVTIVGTRMINSELSWDSAIFYNLNTMSVSNGTDNSNVVMPLIMNILPTLFANKSDIISYLTDGSNRAELQVEINKTNNSKAWVK